MNSVILVSFIAVLRVFLYLFFYRVLIHLSPEAFDLHIQNLITTLFIVFSYIIVIRVFMKKYPTITDRKLTDSAFLFFIALLYAVGFGNSILYSVIKSGFNPSLYTGSYYLIVESKELFAVSLIVLEPFFEEILYRKIMIDILRKDHSKTKSILISSTLYSLSFLNPYLIVTHFISGVIFSFIYVESESVTSSMFVHFIINLIIVKWMSQLELQNVSLSFFAYLLFGLTLYLYDKRERFKLMREKGR